MRKNSGIVRVRKKRKKSRKKLRKKDKIHMKNLLILSEFVLFLTKRDKKEKKGEKTYQKMSFFKCRGGFYR